jgi:hypothetical protein
MRAAILHLAFAGLAARQARSEAFADSRASDRISEALGYEPNGTSWATRRGEVAPLACWKLARDRWERTRRRDITSRRGAGIPLGRVGRAEEFADLAAYLLSDRSSYVTGSAVNPGRRHQPGPLPPAPGDCAGVGYRAWAAHQDRAMHAARTLPFSWRIWPGLRPARN